MSLRANKPKVWHPLTVSQRGYLERHLWPLYAEALDARRNGGPACHIDFIHMTLWVGGKKMTQSDHEQALARLLPPGCGWEAEQPPARAATAATTA